MSLSLFLSLLRPEAANPFTMTRLDEMHRLGSTRKLILVLIVCVGLLPSAVPWSFGHNRNCVTTVDRRRALHTIFGGAVSISIWSSPLPSAQARNLPEPPTVDTSKAGTVEALVPVVKLQQNMFNIQSSLEAGASANELDNLLRSVPIDEKGFKGIFDAYSDPVSYKQKFLDQNAFLVYYSKGFDGPNRPNIESDLPVKQTIQFGARNDAWIFWYDFLAEVDFAKKHLESSNQADMLNPLTKAMDAVGEYLRQSPREDVAKAKGQVE
jgi:hypothetical protein